MKNDVSKRNSSVDNSGSGMTRYSVMPNIMQENYIITDPKTEIVNIVNRIITDRKKLKNPNTLIVGGSGLGSGYHIWDNLNPCPKCGGSPWAVGKNGKDYDSGSPYQIVCQNKKCRHKSISSESFGVAGDDWNGGIVKEGVTYADKQL